MGLLDSITGIVMMRYKADVADAKAKVRELSGEQKKAAKEAADGLEAQGKAAEDLTAKWAKGAAVIAGAYLVARDGMQAYREDARLVAGSVGVDLDQLSEAYDGLKTRTELMTLAQAGSRGAWKLTTNQIELVISGMRSLEAKGYDAQKVFERFTDVMKKGKTEGLDDFGLSVVATGDQAQDLQVLMKALGQSVADVGGNFAMAGDAAQRASVKMEDGLSRVRVAAGQALNVVVDLAQGLGNLAGRAVFGPIKDDPGVASRAKVYGDKLFETRGGKTGSLDDQLQRAIKAVDDGQVLSSFKREFNFGRYKDPEQLARAVSGLPEDWRKVDGILAKRVDEMAVKLDDQMAKAGVAAARSLWGKMREGLQKGSEAEKKRTGGGRGRGGAAGAGGSGDTLFADVLGTLDDFGNYLVQLAGEKRASDAADRQLRGDIANRGMADDFASIKSSLGAVLAEFDKRSSEEETFLTKVFGPLDEVDAYAEALGTLSQVGQAAWGALVGAIASGEEISGKAIRRAIGNVLAAKATDLGADGLAAVLRGTYHTVTGDPRGPLEIAAGGAMIAGSLAIAGAARAIGGAAGPSLPAARGGAGGTAGGARTNGELAAGDGRPTYVVIGGSFEDMSPRQRARQVYRAVTSTTTAYRPPEGSA